MPQPRVGEVFPVPQEHIDQFGIPELGWLAARACWLELSDEALFLLEARAVGLDGAWCAKHLRRDPALIKSCYGSIGRLLGARNPAHGIRIALEADLLDITLPKGVQNPPLRLPRLQIGVLDFISRGRTTEQFAVHQGVTAPTGALWMRRNNEQLAANGAPGGSLVPHAVWRAYANNIWEPDPAVPQQAIDYFPNGTIPMPDGGDYAAVLTPTNADPSAAHR